MSRVSRSGHGSRARRVLDDAQQRQLLALQPSAFDNDRGTWAIIRAETYHLRGSQAQARAAAESARLGLEPLLTMPFYLSPGWLRIDPTLAPLKGNPRLERLVAGR